MKKFTLISILLLSQSVIWSQGELLDKIVSIEFFQSPLESALFQLSEENEISISFINDQIPSKIINRSFKEKTIGFVLDQLFQNTQLKYQEQANQIVVFLEAEKKRKYILSGFISDSINGEKLIEANIYNPMNLEGTTSNYFGFYSLKVPAGKLQIRYSYLGYSEITKTIEVKGDLELNIQLARNLKFPEIIVTAKDTNLLLEPKDFGGRNVPLEKFSLSPSLGGQDDLFRNLHLYSGIQTGADGVGDLHVRGGSSDQNLVLLDGVPVYSPSHALGVISIFNQSSVNEAKVYKGDFPARYSGRLSSVIDIKTKDGNLNHFQGEVGIGGISASAQLEGPIWKDKSSFFLSARRSILDFVVKPISKKLKEEDGIDGYLNYLFYDINGKINFNFGSKVKVFASYYRGNDQYENFNNTEITEEFLAYEIDDDQDYQWGNEIYSFKTNAVLNKQLFLNTGLSFTNFNFENNLKYQLTNTNETSNLIEFTELQDFKSNIQDWSFNADFDFLPSPNHFLKFGLNYTSHLFKPTVFSLVQDIPILEDSLDIIIEDVEKALSTKSSSISIYFEDDIRISKKIKLNIGAHNSWWSSDGYTQSDFQPRLRMNYQINPSLQFHVSYAEMRQYLHLLNGSGVGLPSDLWLPATEKVRPQYSYHWNAGLVFDMGNMYRFKMDAYSKKMNNLIAYKEIFGSNFAFTLDAENWESQVTSGQGQSNGLEFNLSKHSGKLSWNLNYTLSKTTRQFEENNFGREYPYQYDRRHDFKSVFIWQLSKRFSLSSSFVYGSGLATTLPRANFIYNSAIIIPIPGEKNDFRLPSYHRLDLGAKLLFNKGKIKQELKFGIYNVYNRKNPLYIRQRFVENSVRELEFVQVTLIPFLPYFDYKVKF